MSPDSRSRLAFGLARPDDLRAARLVLAAVLMLSGIGVGLGTPRRAGALALGRVSYALTSAAVTVIGAPDNGFYPVTCNGTAGWAHYTYLR